VNVLPAGRMPRVITALLSLYADDGSEELQSDVLFKNFKNKIHQNLKSESPWCLQQLLKISAHPAAQSLVKDDVK